MFQELRNVWESFAALTEVARIPVARHTVSVVLHPRVRLHLDKAIIGLRFLCGVETQKDQALCCRRRVGVVEAKHELNLGV